MRSLPLLLALGAVLVLSSGACGSSSGGHGGNGGIGAGGSGAGGSGGPPSPMEAAFCRPWANLLCQSASGCGCFATYTTTPIDAKSCEDNLTATCVESYASKVANKNLTLDTDAAGLCVQSLRRIGACERIEGFCRPFFVEPVDVNGTCGDVSDACASGTGSCQGGTCTKLPDEQGQSCGGSGCLGDLTCIAGTCQPQIQPGTPCAGDIGCNAPLHCVEGACGPLRDQGAACKRDTSCKLGMQCEKATNTCQPAPTGTCGGGTPCGNLAYCAPLQTCGPALVQNANCVKDSECATGLLCLGHVCAPPPGLNQPCLPDRTCATGYVCDKQMMGRCILAPVKGQDCYWNAEGKYACGGSWVCVKGKCADAPDRGKPCADDGSCAAGLVCRRAQQICASPVAIGGSCTPGGPDCGPDGRCSAAGRCEARGSVGDRCATPEDCKASMDCAPDASGLPVCRPLPATGATCGWLCASAADRCEQKGAAGCQPVLCGQIGDL